MVFEKNDNTRPFAIIECKRDGISDAEFTQAIERVYGNGTWQKFRAKYVMVVFNKKYVLAENLQGYDHAYTSTEFYVVEPDTLKVNPCYLYSMFFCSFVYAQVRGKTTGSSGRRRLDPAMLANLEIPFPAKSMQDSIAQEVQRRRELARALREDAAREWEQAKAEFERRLLESS